MAYTERDQRSFHYMTPRNKRRFIENLTDEEYRRLMQTGTVFNTADAMNDRISSNQASVRLARRREQENRAKERAFIKANTADAASLFDMPSTVVNNQAAMTPTNQTALYKDDVGWWEGLSIPKWGKEGKTSLEEQHQIMGNRYPDRGKDLRSWGEVPFTETATNLLNYFPGIQIGPTAEEWANQQIDKQVQQQAENQLLAEQRKTMPYLTASPKNLSDEEFANTYKEQMNLALAQPSPTGTRAGDWLYNAGSNLYKKSIFDSSEKWAEDEINRQEQLQAEKQLLAEQRKTMPYLTASPKNLSDEEFARTYGEQRKLGQPSPTGTAAGDWMLKTGKNLYDWSIFNEVDGMSPNQWADAQIDKIEAEREYNLPENVAAREVAKKREEMHQAGIWADSELDRIEADRAAVEAAKVAEYEAAGIWADDEITRQETARRLAKKAEEKAKAAEYEAAGIWATDEIVRQETEQRAARRAAEDAKTNRLAAIQAGIDADAGRTTQENYELYAGIDRSKEELTFKGWLAKQREKESLGAIMKKGIEDVIESITPDKLLDSVTEAMNDESNDEWATEKANAIKRWLAEDQEKENLGTLMKEGIKSWGNIALNYVLGLGDNDNDGLEENEVKEVIEVVEDLAKQSQVEAVTEVKQQDGLLVDSTKTATSLLDVDPAKTTISAVSDDSIFTTAGDSTKGFTMDRLKNPLSPENKAWWLEKRPGDIPGNNRAVEFFNTLAYIGTPLKYRSSQTPSESLQERKIKHMNNQLDYAASQTSTAPTFASLRAAVPSHQVIEDTIRGQVEAGADKGLLFGLIGGDDSDDIDNMIAEKATIIREKMLQMTLANNIIPSIQEAIDALSSPTTAPPPPPQGEGDGVIAKGVNFFRELF